MLNNTRMASPKSCNINDNNHQSAQNAADAESLLQAFFHTTLPVPCEAEDPALLPAWRTFASLPPKVQRALHAAHATRALEA